MEFTSYQLAIFFSGKNVFITGGTGYLGRVLIHKLLSYCPDIGDLYLLVREKKGVSQEKRLEEMRSHFLFQDIEAKIPGQLNKVKVVQGDVSQEGDLQLSSRQSFLAIKPKCIFRSRFVRS